MENQTCDILEQIRLDYYRLTASERKIADYVCHNAPKVQFLSITELAQACSVADSTVTRFCRSLNQPGFNAFKLELARNLVVTGEQEEQPFDDTIQGRCRKTAAQVQLAMEKTIQVIDEDALDQAVTILEKAGRVLVIGTGGGLHTATKWAHIFSTVSDKFKAVGDTHMQSMELAMMSENDAVLMVSYSGATKNGIEILALARSYGIPTILVSHFPQSPAAEYADVVLRIGYDENPLDIGTMPTRVAAMMVQDMLLQEYYRRNKEQCEVHRRRIAEAIATQHV